MRFFSNDYVFRGLGPTNAEPKYLDNLEYIDFAGFNSADSDWWLTERTATTPEEQEITESVPYMQGEYDFSMYDQERFFKIRELTYKFMYFGKIYQERKAYEEELKRQLLPHGYSKLIDSHDPVYCWSAKCTNVEVEDDQDKGTMTATVTFKAYPFAYTNHNEGADYWDDVAFDHWIWQPVRFTVNGNQDVNVRNIGSRPVECSFQLSGSVTLKNDSIGEIGLTQDNYKTTTIVLEMGDNKIHLSGNGTIEFQFKREEMI